MMYRWENAVKSPRKPGLGAVRSVQTAFKLYQGRPEPADDAFFDRAIEILKGTPQSITDPIEEIPSFAKLPCQAPFSFKYLRVGRFQMFLTRPAQGEELGETGFSRKPRFGGVAGKKDSALLPRRAAHAIERALLPRVLAKGAERFARVGKVAILQQMKPHFDVHDLQEFWIKPALAVFLAKQHCGRLADQICIPGKTCRDNTVSVMAAISQGPPNIGHA